MSNTSEGSFGGFDPAGAFGLLTDQELGANLQLAAYQQEQDPVEREFPFDLRPEEGGPGLGRGLGSRDRHFRRVFPAELALDA